MAAIHSAEGKEQFVQIFKSNATDVGRACKAFGISRQTFYDWMKDPDTTFAQAIAEAREEMKDFGESQLLMLMKGIPKLDDDGKHTGWRVRPDTACVIFFNKTKNKDRGYDERHIIAPEGGGLFASGVTINVASPDQAKALKEFLEGDGSQPK
jgi:hypothetical protein